MGVFLSIVKLVRRGHADLMGSSLVFLAKIYLFMHFGTLAVNTLSQKRKCLILRSASATAQSLSLLQPPPSCMFVCLFVCYINTKARKQRGFVMQLSGLTMSATFDIKLHVSRVLACHQCHV